MKKNNKRNNNKTISTHSKSVRKSSKSISTRKPSPSRIPSKIIKSKSVSKSAQIVRSRPSRSSSNRTTVSKVKTSKTPMSVSGMINLITDAIQYKFADDKSAPGLTISKLKNGDVYVSVVRFGSYFGKDKMVEYKARSTNLMTSLMDVACQIIEDQEETNPIAQLSKHLFTTEKNVSSMVIYDME